MKSSQHHSAAAVAPSTTLMIVVFQRRSSRPLCPPPSCNITAQSLFCLPAMSATTITSLTGILPSEAESRCCRLLVRPSSPPQLCQTGPGELLLVKPGAATVATHVTVCLLGNLPEDTKLSDESGGAEDAAGFLRGTELLISCSSLYSSL